jgi:hypothetical protein
MAVLGPRIELAHARPCQNRRLHYNLVVVSKAELDRRSSHPPVIHLYPALITRHLEFQRLQEIPLLVG